MARSLVVELAIMLAGAASDIEALRQFCVFAAVAVLVDFALQVSFFVTVLSIDIRRLELVDLQDARLLGMLTSPPPSPGPGMEESPAMGTPTAAAPAAKRVVVRPSVLSALLVSERIGRHTRARTH